MIDTNPTLIQKKVDTHLDYSEIYRTQETFQLKKRLRKTRIILLISAAIMLAGGGVLFLMPESPFDWKYLLLYFSVASLFVLLSFRSNKYPFYTVLTALLICLGLWGFEMVTSSMTQLLIETSIHKLFIVSLLVWRFHPSREAELIRKELHFS